MSTKLQEVLDRYTKQINVKEFIENDPVKFIHRYTKKQDIEIVAFVISSIAWGRRAMILRSAERLLEAMGVSPYSYVLSKKYENLDNKNVHRTFFEEDLKYMLRGLNYIYSNYESIEDFYNQSNIVLAQNLSMLPNIAVLKLNKSLQCACIKANNEAINKKCFAGICEKSALKRINLALRWLVRDDGIVDLGIWKSIVPSDLYIPLDVHVGNTARTLNLLKRSTNDWKAVLELTHNLRKYSIDDPIKYDFALFGIGVNDSINLL